MDVDIETQLKLDQFVYCRAWIDDSYKFIQFNQIELIKTHHFHKIDGPSIIYRDGSYVWYLDGKLHREGGPAIHLRSLYRYDQYYFHGQKHRIDGPAYISYQVSRTKEKIIQTRQWYLYNESLPGKLVEQWIQNNQIDLSTTQGQTAFKLRWS